MRKHLRLKNYNYRSNGYYFITICADHRRNILSNDKIKKILIDELEKLNAMSNVKVDYKVIMPNHIHIILFLNNSEVSVPDVLRIFKSRTTILVKKIADADIQIDRLWQSNYFEHVIRNENALKSIREYVLNNPLAETIDFKMFYKL